MYTTEDRRRALEIYKETDSVAKTIQILEYPGRSTLFRWIHEERLPPKDISRYRGTNTPSHPRHPSPELKLETLKRCFELGEDIKSVSEEIGYSRSSIYTWRRKYLKKGAVSLMNPRDKPRGELVPGSVSSPRELDKLKEQVQDLQMQVDVLKETINVLKKDPCVDQTNLKNKEKVAIIDALKGKYSLPKLLNILSLSRSSYYYQENLKKREDKYIQIKEKIQTLFEENGQCYGYRRIYLALRKEGIIISEKIIRRLMSQMCLQVKIKNKKGYNSYKGEITPAVENLLKHDFHADKPNEKWITDITEFVIPEGKVYLSPLIDCYDGMPISWNIATEPTAHLTNKMLEKAISRLGEDEHPIVHTDRGCHYRWPGWIELMENAGLIRSMSKKGCTPDNAACEGFFGRMKNEMFYGSSWKDVSIEEFIEKVDCYMKWYCDKRIKLSLGGLSLLEHRQSLGLII